MGQAVNQPLAPATSQAPPLRSMTNSSVASHMAARNARTACAVPSTGESPRFDWSIGIGSGIGSGDGNGNGNGQRIWIGIGVGIPNLTAPNKGIAVPPRTTVVLDVKPNLGIVPPRWERPNVAMLLAGQVVPRANAVTPR